MAIVSHYTAQERDCFFVPEMNVLWWEMCVSTPEQKQQTLQKCCLKLVKECHYPQGNSLSCTDMSWKAAQPGRSHYCKSNIKKPDYSLEMHTGTETLIFGDISCGLMKLKWNCLARMTIVWRKKGEACNTIPAVKYGGCSIMLSRSFAAGGTGALHKTDYIMRKEHYMEIFKEHLKTSVTTLKIGCKWVFQMGFHPKHTPKWITKCLNDNQVNVLEWPPQALISIPQKICRQRWKGMCKNAACEPDSVTPVLSGGVGQYSIKLLWEAWARIPKTTQVIMLKGNATWY